MIELKHVYKSYGEVAIFKDISLSLEDDGIVVVVGDNGSGKTTLLNILSNIIHPDSGNYFFDGEKITKMSTSFRSRIGAVLSEPIFINELNVKRYLEFVCDFQFISKDEVEDRIDFFLNWLNVNDRKNTKIKKLSSGEKKKVSIISSLLHKPDILLWDEPFINLDQQSIDKILKFIVAKNSPKLILIATHNIKLLEDIAMKFLIIEDKDIKIENSNNVKNIILKFNAL